MEPSTPASSTPMAETTQRLARLLRHEVGDLLQSIYSTVAILQERLSEDRPLEKRLVGDLKNRAELCKYELDAVVDLVSTPELNRVRLDLSGLLGAAASAIRRRRPALQVDMEARGPIWVEADARSLSDALVLLFLAIAQGARHQVHIHAGIEQADAVCVITRDGNPVAPEQLVWLEQPFATTQNAVFGLGLANAQRIAQEHGGSIQASLRDQGVLVRLSLPLSSNVP